MVNKMSKKKRTIIIICLIVALYAASKFRISETGDKHFLILYIGESASWTTYPVTIHTDCGDIYLKAFTSIDYSRGHIYSTYNDDNKRDINHNLVYMGNPLNEEIAFIGFTGSGKIDGFGFFDNNPQKFVIDGFTFSIRSFRTDYIDNDVWYRILDFEKITLQDNTVITPESLFSYCILIQSTDYWRLHSADFIVTNPDWEEEKHLDNIVFEPNWGKLISYDETTEDEWD